MAVAIPPLPDMGDRAVQMPANVLDPEYYLFLKGLLNVIADRDAQIADLQARTQLVVKTGVPAVGDVPDGQFRIIKNTTGPTYSLVLNDGGTLKSVALT